MVTLYARILAANAAVPPSKVYIMTTSRCEQP